MAPISIVSRVIGQALEIGAIDVNHIDLPIPITARHKGDGLTDNPANDGLPTWSPDGRVIAFASNRDGPWAVWGMTPTGTDQQVLFVMEGSPEGLVGTDINASRGWTEERMSWIR